MEGYILVLSILILSGVIATVGDRLGTRVGKARLSLFGLRPRKTAVVITIVTGGVISATTLGILFAVNDGLRDIFRIEDFRDQQREAKNALAQANAEKKSVEAQLESVRAEQARVQKDLDNTNRSLQEAKERQTLTEEQLLDEEDRAEQLREEVESLQQQQAELIAQRDRVQTQIAQRDREIQKQEEIITQGENQLQALEKTQAFLTEEVQKLEQDYDLLRTGNVALTRGQVLVNRVIQIRDSTITASVVDLLLREVNRVAVQRTRPGAGDPNEPLIQTTQAEVDRLIQVLNSGQEYVVRILAAENYIVGTDKRVQIFIDVAMNEVLFPSGEVLAKTSTDPATMDVQEMRQRLDLLIAASQFRAERAGIVSDSVEIRVQTFVDFFERVATYNKPLTIQAVALEPIYTTGPLRLQFIALENDREVFRSDEQIARGSGF